MYHSYSNGATMVLEQSLWEVDRRVYGLAMGLVGEFSSVGRMRVLRNTTISAKLTELCLFTPNVPLVGRSSRKHFG